MPQDTAPDAPKRKRKTVDRLQLSDESAKPGLSFVERYAHAKRPSPEDQAILDAWAFRFIPDAGQRHRDALKK